MPLLKVSVPLLGELLFPGQGIRVTRFYHDDTDPSVLMLTVTGSNIPSCKEVECIITRHNNPARFTYQFRPYDPALPRKRPHPGDG